MRYPAGRTPAGRAGDILIEAGVTIEYPAIVESGILNFTGARFFNGEYSFNGEIQFDGILPGAPTLIKAGIAGQVDTYPATLKAGIAEEGMFPAFIRSNVLNSIAIFSALVEANLLNVSYDAPARIKANLLNIARQHPVLLSGGIITIKLYPAEVEALLRQFEIQRLISGGAWETVKLIQTMAQRTWTDEFDFSIGTKYSYRMRELPQEEGAHITLTATQDFLSVRLDWVVDE